MMTLPHPKILGIDDDEDCLEELRAAVTLAFPGARFFAADNAPQGIERALAENPDLILLDIIMPGMDGFETCRRLKEDSRLNDIPVIFLTAVEPDLNICERAFSAGAEAFILKPLKLWDLAVQVRAMMKIKAANCAQRVEKEESERMFKTIFTEAPAGICLIDAQTGRFLRVNPTLAGIIGKTEEELHGTDWRLVTHPDDIKPQSEGMAMLESRRIGVFRMENRYIRPDGSTIWAKLTVTPLPSPGRGAPRYLGMVEDISTVKTAEQERALLEEQLRQAQKMETAGRLAGGVAHDFNNIISAILAYSEFLENALRKDTPERRDASEIKRSALRAAALTRQLLAFSRKQVLQPKVLDVNAVIGGMKPMLGRVLGEDIKLTALTRHESALIKADPCCLEQVIMNLCVNARDAMPKGGKLTVEAAITRLDAEYIQRHGTIAPGNYVMLAVSDNGCGMTADTKSRLFEPFFTTKPRDKGTGLGLSTVHGIVKQSGGNIVVYSEENRGTVFKIYFPLVHGDIPRSAPPAAITRAGAASGTVLVVDDDHQIRTLACRILAGDGLSVLVAGSAEEALSVYKRRKGEIRLLLTDIVLPKMTGLELAELLKSGSPGIKVIYMSGYTDHSVLADGMLPPDKCFIQKPFTLDMLTQKVRDALASPVA